MIWFGILIGSLMRSVEAVNGVMFTVLFPITFLANTFAPTEPMPHVAAGDRRMEPGVLAGAGDARVVGQRPARAAGGATAAASSGAVHDPVVAGDDGGLRAVRAARLRAADVGLAPRHIRELCGVALIPGGDLHAPRAATGLLFDRLADSESKTGAVVVVVRRYVAVAAAAAVAATTWAGSAWAGGPGGVVEDVGDISEAVGSGLLNGALVGFSATGSTNEATSAAVIAACQQAGAQDCELDYVTCSVRQLS